MVEDISYNQANNSQTGPPPGTTVPDIPEGAVKVRNFLDKIVAIFGGLPRGNYAKFSRVMYPPMFYQAFETALPVRCLWYEGEIIEVRANGDFGVVARGHTVTTMWAFYLQAAAFGDSFFGVFCGTDAPNTVDEFSQMCAFKYFGPDKVPEDRPPIVSKPPEVPIEPGAPPVEMGMGLTLVIIAIVATIVAVALGFFGK